jgi:hypothetical protein
MYFSLFVCVAMCQLGDEFIIIYFGFDLFRTQITITSFYS